METTTTVSAVDICVRHTIVRPARTSLVSWFEQHPGHHVPATTGRQPGAVKPAAPPGAAREPRLDGTRLATQTHGT